MKLSSFFISSAEQKPDQAGLAGRVSTRILARDVFYTPDVFPVTQPTVSRQSWQPPAMSMSSLSILDFIWS